jgi:hypothetical protein
VTPSGRSAVRQALTRAAPDAGLDQVDGELGTPLERPALLEGARGPSTVGRLAPPDAEQAQPVEEDRPGELAVAAQVQVDLLDGRRGPEPQGPLLASEVGGQRDHR